MASSSFRTLLLAPLVLTLAVSCGIENNPKGSDKSVEECEDPVANAGPDQDVALGSTATVDGSGSTVCDTDAIAYIWAFESIPTDSTIDESALSDNKTATAETVAFTPDVPGDYVLSLEVTDGTNRSRPDLVVVTVTADDAPPVADCGDSVSGTIGIRTTMDGSLSFDPEGAELAFAWSLASVPSCSDMTDADLYDASLYNASLIPDCEGIYVASLVVSDGHQWSEPDLCYIDVSSDNNVPIADAGDSTDLNPCYGNVLQLNGFGSYDLDGDALTYEWSLVSAPSGSAASNSDFSSTASANPTFTLPDDPAVPGDYVFALQVNDGTDWSAPDIVTFTVVGESVNNAPIANAGDDQSIETDADCAVGTSYAWNCEDCAGETLDLDGSSSYDPDGDDVTFLWSEATGVVDFESPRSPLTGATVPGVPAEFAVETTVVYDITLAVADGCGAVGSDGLQITYTCLGLRTR